MTDLPPSPNPLPTTEGVTQGWQDIATAPKDGTPILLWGTRYNVSQAQRTCHAGIYSRGWWSLGYGAYPICHVTHWQPLPPPPGSQS